jgi:UDP-N-acetylmuramyl pentapeptide phosphotransferase/UDP-N-acetylglucosamine-1-phosphate transferase
LVVSLAVAVAIVPAAVRGLHTQGFVRQNYRGRQVAFPAGIALIAASLVALAPLALVDELDDGKVFKPDIGMAVTYVLGVALLGLLDDLVGAEAPARGWRGHARATLSGAFSTGALKAIGSFALALFVLRGRGLATGDYVLAVVLVVLTTNLFNLLDLRPGRSLKALVLVGAGVSIGSRDLYPLWTLGLFIGPALLLLPLDLRERGMLGDTGSNAVGAIAGLWFVLALSTLAQMIAVGLIAIATVYGEFRSLSELIEKTPVLRHLDSIGRAHA